MLQASSATSTTTNLSHSGMVTRTQREDNAKNLVECGHLMFHSGATALSLLSASAHYRQSPRYSLLPNQAHAFSPPNTTDPDETRTTQPGESKGRA